MKTKPSCSCFRFEEKTPSPKVAFVRSHDSVDVMVFRFGCQQERFRKMNSLKHRLSLSEFSLTVIINSFTFRQNFCSLTSCQIRSAGQKQFVCQIGEMYFIIFHTSKTIQTGPESAFLKELSSVFSVLSSVFIRCHKRTNTFGCCRIFGELYSKSFRVFRAHTSNSRA